jgi:hypothetical protein
MNMNKPFEEDPLPCEERNRSTFVRNLVQRRGVSSPVPSPYREAVSKCIVQFWDDLGRLPKDVEGCMETWKELHKSGFEIQVFDENAARDFIRLRLGARYEQAFDKCYHPSMKSDYFRYSYIYVEGGFYVDADDVYYGTSIDHHFRDGRLKLQPFCYDIATAQMVSPTIFTKPGVDQLSWIFYFNTTPLIAGPKHPIIERALLNATISLERDLQGELPEVQATTGPGNLTRSIYEILSNESCPEDVFVVVQDWEKTSASKWPLSYRNDRRNWRLSNRQEYRAAEEL